MLVVLHLEESRKQLSYGCKYPGTDVLWGQMSGGGKCLKGADVLWGKCRGGGERYLRGRCPTGANVQGADVLRGQMSGATSPGADVQGASVLIPYHI